MAEFWFAATGPYHWLKLFETHMQSQSFYLDGVAPNGQQMTTHMKGILEPVNLYRFVVPATAMNLVRSTFKPYIEQKNRSTILNIGAAALRKSLGLKDFPNAPYSDVSMPVSLDHLQILPIGEKEDPVRQILTTGVTQEAI